MCPAVMRDFMAGRDHGLAGAGMALDGEARDEPCRAYAKALEQVENAARADKAKFPARQCRRRGHAARDEARLRVEIEAQADNVARHAASPGRVELGGSR